MNPITKLFIVLLVVFSLLSSAGFIVFVNQVQNFKVAQADYKGKLDQATKVATDANAKAAGLQSQLTSMTNELSTARQETVTVSNDAANKLASAQVELADAKAQNRVQLATVDSAAAALKASEDQRTSLNTALTSSRADLDALNRKYLDDEIAINDKVQQLDVANRKVTDLSEQVAEAKSQGDRLVAQIKEAGGTPGQVASNKVQYSAPMINGVVRHTDQTNGQPYATISVGSAEQVTKGMVFQVFDRTHSKYLGELTINAVDLHEASGKLEGPDVNDVKAGVTEVKTQL